MVMQMVVVKELSKITLLTCRLELVQWKYEQMGYSFKLF